MIAFFVITAVLSLITVWFAAGYCSVLTKPLIKTEDIGDVNIDATDFTPFVKAGVFVFNKIRSGGRFTWLHNCVLYPCEKRLNIDKLTVMPAEPGDYVFDLHRQAEKFIDRFIWR